MKIVALLFTCFLTLTAAADDMIVVGGVGKVNVTPDMAICRFSVEVKNREAVKAQRENAKIVSDVVKGLKSKFKLADKDIVTTYFRVEPQYNYTSNKRVFEGHSVQNGIQVRLRDATKLGELLDYLTGTGVNQIESISFTHNDWDKLKKEALKLSVADAREKATLLAGEAKRRLGKVQTIVEEGVQGHPPMPMLERGMMMGAQMMSADAQTPIQAGELEITSSVQVSFELE